MVVCRILSSNQISRIFASDLSPLNALRVLCVHVPWSCDVISSPLESHPRLWRVSMSAPGGLLREHTHVPPHMLNAAVPHALPRDLRRNNISTLLPDVFTTLSQLRTLYARGYLSIVWVAYYQ
jgi:hypothetical protein